MRSGLHTHFQKCTYYVEWNVLGWSRVLEEESWLNVKCHLGNIMEIWNMCGISEPGELISTFLLGVDAAICEKSPRFGI